MSTRPTKSKNPDVNLMIAVLSLTRVVSFFSPLCTGSKKRTTFHIWKLHFFVFESNSDLLGVDERRIDTNNRRYTCLSVFYQAELFIKGCTADIILGMQYFPYLVQEREFKTE